MIRFEGFERIIERVYKYEQDHIFQYWHELNEYEKKNLINDLAGIDFNLMYELYHQKVEIPHKKNIFKPSQYISIDESKKISNINIEAKEKGEEYISNGKMAALLVAGGQGTRLGYSGPKGKFPISPVMSKSLFQIHTEKIIKYSEKYNISIPLLIMTSYENNTETKNFFIKNVYFGLNKNDVYFFTQGVIPSLDLNGKLLLKSKSGLCLNPDGHGGTLTALLKSGLLEKLKELGVEILSYFQVDNPLVKIIDPVFTGFHILNTSDVSSKAVMKKPREKVGIFVTFEDGKTGIIEYSDMPEDMQVARDESGTLLFRMGNIAAHLFKRTYIESLTSGKIYLPYHIAKKKINCLINGIKSEIIGFKYERFIFDALTLTENNTIMETLREEEFAPVKNAEEVDSPYTAKKLMSDLSRKWLVERNISIPDNVKVIEISPLLAVEADDLPYNFSLPAKEKVYIS